VGEEKIKEARKKVEELGLENEVKKLLEYEKESRRKFESMVQGNIKLIIRLDYTIDKIMNKNENENEISNAFVKTLRTNIQFAA
jgi:hypothetical protein